MNKGHGLKKTGWSLIIFGAILLITLGAFYVVSDYRWENEYGSLWSLGVKQSSIADKQKYVLAFKGNLISNKSDFTDNNALFLKTPNNSFDKNLEALESLSSRLTQIQGMDPASFQYNTAIEQITRQEQDEAGAMLGVFEGCWYLHNFPFLWGWIGGVLVVIGALGVFAGVMAIAYYVEYR